MIPLCGVIRFAFPLTNDVIGPLNHVRSAPAIYNREVQTISHKGWQSHTVERPDGAIDGASTCSSMDW